MPIVVGDGDDASTVAAVLPHSVRLGVVEVGVGSDLKRDLYGIVGRACHCVVYVQLPELSAECGESVEEDCGNNRDEQTHTQAFEREVMSSLDAIWWGDCH